MTVQTKGDSHMFIVTRPNWREGTTFWSETAKRFVPDVRHATRHCYAVAAAIAWSEGAAVQVAHTVGDKTYVW
jgi:hypothetical protein